MSQPLIMSYRPYAAEACLDGRKTETRRLWVPGEMSMIFGPVPDDPERFRAIEIRRNGRKVWRVGEPCTIKPGRTAKGMGRVVIEHLGVETVQEITDEAAEREWVDGGREGYRQVWERLHRRAPYRWHDNPWVVVIRFRPEEVKP